MKKIIIITLLLVLLASCNSNNELQETKTTEEVNTWSIEIVENITGSGGEDWNDENEREIKKSSDRNKFNYIASTDMSVPFSVDEYDNNFIYRAGWGSIEKKWQWELKQIIYLIEDNFFEDFKKDFWQDFWNKEKLLFKNWKYYWGTSMYYDNNYIYFLPSEEICETYISIPENIKIEGDLLMTFWEDDIYDIYKDNNNSYEIDDKSCLLKLIK